jgi:hypothetical protein
MASSSTPRRSSRSPERMWEEEAFGVFGIDPNDLPQRMAQAAHFERLIKLPLFEDLVKDISKCEEEEEQ